MAAQLSRVSTMLLPVNSQLQATITLHSTTEFTECTGTGGTAAQLSTILLPVTSQLQSTVTLHSTPEFTQYTRVVARQLSSAPCCCWSIANSRLPLLCTVHQSSQSTPGLVARQLSSAPCCCQLIASSRLPLPCTIHQSSQSQLQATITLNNTQEFKQYTGTGAKQLSSGPCCCRSIASSRLPLTCTAHQS
jgi:hypothetical protein